MPGCCTLLVVAPRRHGPKRCGSVRRARRAGPRGGDGPQSPSAWCRRRSREADPWTNRREGGNAPATAALVSVAERSYGPPTRLSPLGSAVHERRRAVRHAGRPGRPGGAACRGGIAQPAGAPLPAPVRDRRAACRRPGVRSRAGAVRLLAARPRPVHPQPRPVRDRGRALGGAGAGAVRLGARAAAALHGCLRAAPRAAVADRNGPRGRARPAIRSRRRHRRARELRSRSRVAARPVPRRPARRALAPHRLGGPRRAAPPPGEPNACLCLPTTHATVGADRRPPPDAGAPPRPEPRRRALPALDPASAASAADRMALLAGELSERALVGDVLDPAVVDQRDREHALAAHSEVLDRTVVLLGVVRAR